MSLAEEVVERFITCNGWRDSGLALVCPQYEITQWQNQSWSASFDFLVLYFGRSESERCVIVVEVSDSGGLGSVYDKAESFERDDYFARVRTCVSEQTDKLTENWPLRFIGFVRTSQLVGQARKRFPDRERFTFRSIDEAFSEGWWEVREKGL